MVPYYIDIDLFGDIQADRLITKGGLESQFVKGDGSLDSTSYASEDWVNSQGFLTSIDPDDFDLANYFTMNQSDFRFLKLNFGSEQTVIGDIKFSKSPTIPDGTLPTDAANMQNLLSAANQAREEAKTWVINQEYLTNQDLIIYTAGEGLDLVDNEFSLTQTVIDALGEAHTHDNKDVLDEISSEDVDNWDEAYAKSHTHDNKTLLDSLDQDDLDEWNEAYTKSHEHSNKTTLDGITDSDIANWNSKIDEVFADSKYALRETKVSAGSGLTGGGNLTQDRTIGLSSGTLSDIGKGVEAHSYTLDDVAKNDNTTTVKLVGDSVFSNTEAEDYAQMEDLWKAGWSIQYLASEFKLVLRRRDDFIISEVDLSSLISGDLSITIDDTDPNDPEIVFTQDGVEVGRVPASALLTGVVNSGELVGEQLHFKDRTGTTVINIDLSPVLEVKAEKTTTINAGTGLSGGGTLASNRTIDFDTSWGDDRYQRVITAGDNISISGNEISATDTKYSAGNGLTLSGTTFSLPVSVTGNGSFVKGVTQGTNGINIELGTPPNTNTTYSNMTLTELNAGTVTTARSISAKTLTDWGNGKYALRTRTISAGTGLTGGGNLTANRTFSFDTTWGDNRYVSIVDTNLGRTRLSRAYVSKITQASDLVNLVNGEVLFTYGGDIPLDLTPEPNGTFVTFKGDREHHNRFIWFNHSDLGFYIGRKSSSDNTPPTWTRIADREWVNSQSSLQNYYTKTESNSRYVLKSGDIMSGSLESRNSLEIWTNSQSNNREGIFEIRRANSRSEAYGSSNWADMRIIFNNSFTLERRLNGVTNNLLEISSTGVPTFESLSGTGTRMVTVNASGTLGTQAIPTGNATHTGDVTGATVLTIANDAVTHAKYQNIKTQRILGRGATGTGNVQELTLGANLSLTTAGVLSATNTNTTYSAGTGLSLSGTTFGQTITTSGTGTFVTGITQTASGFQVNLGAPPNTTYSAGTLALLNTGTNTSNRVWGAKVIADYVKQYAGTNLGLQGVTEIGNWTRNRVIFQEKSAPHSNVLEIGHVDLATYSGAVIAGYHSSSSKKGDLLITAGINNVNDIDKFSGSGGGAGLTLSNLKVGFSLGYEGTWDKKYITDATPGNYQYHQIRLDWEQHADERLLKNNEGGFSRQVLQYPPESGTLATREWILEGDDSGTTPPTGDPSVGITFNDIYRTYRLRNNFTFDHVNKAIDAVDTTYSRGNGITLTGTTFSQVLTTSGSGTYVQSLTRTAGGIQANLGTPPNQTYSQASLAQLRAGTNATNRLINPNHVKTVIDEEVLPKQTISTGTTTIGVLNGHTIILNSTSSGVGLGNSTNLPANFEAYLVNNTTSNRPLWNASGITYKINGGATTTNTIYLKAGGVGTVIRVGNTGVVLALGDFDL